MDLSIESLKTLTNELVSWSVSAVPTFILALLTLIVGFWLIGKVMKQVGHSLESSEIEPTLGRFAINILSISLKVILFVTVAGILGVATTSFVAVLGAAGLAIGLALQGNLANFAGGALILLFKPFKVGDYIIAQGTEGTVVDINVFCTALNTLDNQRVYVPNGPLSSNVLKNLSTNPTRRVDVSVVLDGEVPVHTAQKMFLEMLQGHPLLVDHPEPLVSIEKFSELGVHYTIRAWTHTENYWDTYFELHEFTKHTLEINKISGAVPTRIIKNSIQTLNQATPVELRQ